MKLAKLYKIQKDKPALLLVEKLEIAESFWARGKGLLGRKILPDGDALWIKPCNNIHTFFMRFTIDCVFIDEKLQVTHVSEGVKPFRVVGPYWKAVSVLEFPAGAAQKWDLQKGDQLYVVS
ncbi:MAG: DUF192 domain-containing protein [Pseudobdellovibrio sp.]